MSTDLAYLNEKIDQLSAIVAEQNETIKAMEARTNGNPQVLEKINMIAAHIEAQQRQQEEWNELKRDVVPIVNQMIKLSIDELAEIGSDFRLEDLFFLLKRLLRDTDLLFDLLSRMEGALELLDETQRLGTQVFHHAVIKLDEMEREGYFAFAREGWRIVERILTEFSEDDVRALADNIVTILTTVKNMTQPEIMALADNAVQAIKQTPVSEESASVWALLKDMRDPKVRMGLAKLLNLLKVLAEQSDQSINQSN